MNRAFIGLNRPFLDLEKGWSPGWRIGVLALLMLGGCFRDSYPKARIAENRLIGSYYQRNHRVIMRIQLALVDRGLHSGSVDGVFGPKTRYSIKLFQEANRLPPSGYVDDATWSKFQRVLDNNPSLSIKKIQGGLRHAGADPGPVDGIWGDRSDEAVERFQENRGLHSTGMLDAPTWEALGLYMNRSVPLPDTNG